MHCTATAVAPATACDAATAISAALDVGHSLAEFAIRSLAVQQPRGHVNPLTRKLIARRAFSFTFFFEDIREMENRLLPKPLRGAAAAASGLWGEGD